MWDLQKTRAARAQPGTDNAVVRGCGTTCTRKWYYRYEEGPPKNFHQLHREVAAAHKLRSGVALVVVAAATKMQHNTTHRGSVRHSFFGVR